MTPIPPTSPEPLNVVALISGGKDSLFSLLHCLANKHKVVALANLYPEHKVSNDPQQENRPTAEWDDDVDSFMYQTAGHNLIPLFSDALRLPLYRQVITGGARDSSLSYAGHTDDETEALIPLLSKVKIAHPEVTAVCSGAILSTYQRTRIESVAVRLGLIPLAFLWQYPSLPPPSPGGLLEDMAKAGFDVRIIKVASGGLTKALLWCNLASSAARNKLERAVSRFGGSILGEGGEYETMVVCGPSGPLDIQHQSDDQDIAAKNSTNKAQIIDQLWQGRIEVADQDMQVVTERGSDSALLSFKHGSGKVSSKTPEDADSGGTKPPKPSLQIPDIFDKQFQEVLKQVPRDGPLMFQKHACPSMTGPGKIAKLAAYRASLSNKQQAGLDGAKGVSDIVAASGTENSSKELTNDEEFQAALTKIKMDHTTHISQIDNLIIAANLTGVAMGATVEEQFSGIKEKLSTILKDLKRPTSSIVFTTLLLKSMNDFTMINPIYGDLFEKPNPPSRVTVACPLPDGIKVMMSVTINMGEKVDALHIQSRSYWAPANIGPYSQAVSTPVIGTSPASQVFVAGQIPLIPASMELLGPLASTSKELSDDISPLYDQFLPRSCLSLQHLWRIGREMKVNWWTGGVAFITGPADQADKAALACGVWQNIHNYELWEDGEGGGDDDDSQTDVWDRKYGGTRSLLTGANDEHHLPDFEQATFLPHEIYPRLCDGYTEICQFQDVDERPGFFAVEVDELPRGSDVEWQSLGVAQSKVRTVTTSISNEEVHLEARSCIIGSTGTCVSFVNVPFYSESEASTNLSRAMDWLRNVSTAGTDMFITIYTPDIALVKDVKAHIVPCRAVWGSDGRRLYAGIVAQFKIRPGMKGSLSV